MRLYLIGIKKSPFHPSERTGGRQNLATQNIAPREDDPLRRERVIWEALIQSLHGRYSGVQQIQVRKAEGIVGLFQGFLSLKMRCSAKAAVNGIDAALTSEAVCRRG